MTITVPEKGSGRKLGRPPKTPRKGRHERCQIAEVREATEDEPGAWTVVWHITDEKRRWTVPQYLTARQLGDVLVALGLAGQEVDETALAGTPAVLTITTFGGRQSAEVLTVEPLPAS